MNEYIINDEYGYKDVALEEEQVKNKSFSIIFVDDKTIQNINKQYRQIDKITDVISFAFLDNEETDDNFTLLGDIYISIPQMQRQAQEYGHSEQRELSFLTVHGLLHLLGYDHTKSLEDEKIMFAKQDKILLLANILR